MTTNMGLKKRPTRVLPQKTRRASGTAVTGTVSAGAKHRLLTLKEAAQIVNETGVPLSSLPSHSSETSKKDKQVLKMYESVTGTKKVRRKGIVLFLRAVLERQKHLKANMNAIAAAGVKARGYRQGKVRLMSLNTYRYCYVSVLRRLYKGQKPNKPSWSGRVCQAVKKLDNLAKTFLGPSVETKAVGVDETTLLIAAMGQGARHFFSHATLMCSLLESGRRVGCFKKRQFKHITSITNITDPLRRNDKRACLIEVVLKRYSDKGEGEGEGDEHDIHLRGSLYWNGFIDSVYFLNRRCVQDYGVPLFDQSTGRSILDHVAADPELAFVLDESLFEVRADRAYVLYRRGQDNTNLDAKFNLRPHGVRKHMYSAGVAALESGEISFANLDGLRSQLGHCPYSRSGRQHYLGGEYLAGLNFGALFHPNPEIRALGVHINAKTMQEKWKMNEPPRVLWTEIAANFDIVEDIVAEKLCRKDAKKHAQGASPRFFAKPSKSRIRRKVNKILLHFGTTHCPESATMSDKDKIHHAKTSVIRTLSSGLDRDQMIHFIERVLLSMK